MPLRPEAMVEFSREKNKTSALLKNPFVFHLETYVNWKVKKSPIMKRANARHAKNVR